MTPPRVGLGLVTFRRPAYFERAAASVLEHLLAGLHAFVVVDDGTPPAERYAEEWTLGRGHLVIQCETNRGVAAAKNAAIRDLLDAGCEWVVLMEDDIEVTSPEAVAGYVAACEQSGYGHLMFHGHGPHNPLPRSVGPAVTMWPNCVGAWCIYSAESLRQCGLMDETFVNAWEHGEHSQRLALAGFTAPWPDNADATGSERWLREQPGAIAASAIRAHPAAGPSPERGRQYWRTAHPDTFRLIWP